MRKPTGTEVLIVLCVLLFLWITAEFIAKLTYKPIEPELRDSRDSMDIEFGEAPVLPSFQFFNEYSVDVTAYSSTVGQTDSTPFITASGYRVREYGIALSRDLLKKYNPDAPFDWHDEIWLSFEKGTYSGPFTVLDSMNERWSNKVDIWCADSLECYRITTGPGKIIIPLDTVTLF